MWSFGCCVSDEYKWANHANPSSISVRPLNERSSKELVYKINERPVTRILSQDLFDQVHDIYAIAYPDWFQPILKGYRNARAKNPFLKVEDYKSSTNLASPEQKLAFKSMSPKVLALRVATLDGVLFTTHAYQAKFKTNNSCVSTLYEKMVTVKSKHGREKTIKTDEICYGVIQSLFLFTFQAPGEDKTTEVIAECDWYEVTGQDPITKLTQVVYNSHFHSCRLFKLSRAFPMNQVLWPTKPFIEVSNPKLKGRRKTVVNKDLAAMATDENFSWDIVHHRQRPVVHIELKS